EAMHIGVQRLVDLGESECAIEVVGFDPDGAGFLAKPAPIGVARDLVALGWDLRRRLDFFQKIVDTVSDFHVGGFAQGVVTPESVLLKEGFSPILLGPNLAWPSNTELYWAPELAQDGPSVQSDIYSLGRFLHFLLLDRDPVARPAGNLLVLNELSKRPAGLVRIIRKCTAADPTTRYGSVVDFLNDLDRYGQYAEVGLPHPEAIEENLSGLMESVRPAVSNRVSGPGRPAMPGRSAVGAIAKPAAARNAGAQASPRVAQGGRAPVRMSGRPSKGAERASVRPKTASVRPGRTSVKPGAQATASNSELRGNLMALGFLVFVMVLGIARFNMDRVRAWMARDGLQGEDTAQRLEAIKKVMRTDRNLRSLDLSGIDLRGIALIGAKLDESNLQGANLSGMDLSHATLRGARLADADLTGADLRTARIDDVRGFREALCDAATKFPGGWTCFRRHPSLEQGR
ncbi:MAG: pentapeptide repeat-containing protein, partial [Myxococcales bacterium]|nr:pentapeptide repeat-containing protein [Myxococcales bacterium]